MTKKLCIATYNVRHGGDVPNDVGCIGRFLNDANVDVVGLQEIDVGTNRMNGMDVLAQIAKGGNYPYSYFAKAMDFDSGAYGIGIVSRCPILSVQTIPLFSGGEEPRVLCHAVIEAGDESIDFFNTHTSYESKEIRTEQLKEISEHLANCERFILTGDFNTANLDEFSLFQPCSIVNRAEYGSFYSTGEGIDNVFVSRDFDISQSVMSPLPYSDHYPILCWVEKA
jgi:endonuclease/exonuclease/phosphatase family metal-dependent hydrolase